MKDANAIMIYVDESGHLANNDGKMVLGCVWGVKSDVLKFCKLVRATKERHGIKIRRELKWTKVSDKKVEYYIDVLKLFKEFDGVNYRAIIIEKSDIENDKWQQSDDDFYYKMVYLLVKNIVERDAGNFKIYLDYKDTASPFRCEELTDFLKGTKKFSDREFDSKPIRSYESSAIQAADFLNGMISFSNRSWTNGTSEAKKRIVKLAEELFAINLKESTGKEKEKVNLFYWRPKFKL